MTEVVGGEEAKGADSANQRIAPVAAGTFTVPDDSGAVRLVGQRCQHCGAVFFPGGRTICIRCYGTDLKTVELDSVGVVDCFTVVRQAPKGYYGRVPYVIGSVALPCESQVIAQLVGKDVEAWRCGEAVTACAFELPRDREGRNVLCYGFRPLPSEEAAASAPRRT